MMYRAGSRIMTFSTLRAVRTWHITRRTEKQVIFSTGHHTRPFWNTRIQGNDLRPERKDMNRYKMKMKRIVFVSENLCEELMIFCSVMLKILCLFVLKVLFLIRQILAYNLMREFWLMFATSAQENERRVVFELKPQINFGFYRHTRGEMCNSSK